MKTTWEIAKELGHYTYKSTSVYFTIKNTLVRISGHLPNVSNFEAYNEDCEKIFMVFVNRPQYNVFHNDTKIEKFLESEMPHGNYDYVIIESDEDIDYAKKMMDLFI